MKVLEIIISATVAFVIAWIWYGKIFKPEKKVDSELAKAKASERTGKYLLIFLALCAVSYFMNNGCLETHINGGSIGHGLFHGGLYALSYAVPIVVIHHLLQGFSAKRIIIDSGFALLSFGAIGATLAVLSLTVYTMN